MPTNPLPAALDRDIAKVEMSDQIKLACPLLQELVNYATNALQRCNLEVADGNEDENVAPLILYRHIIEMTDGIEVLLSQASVTPGIPVLRSSFEAVLQLEYILKDPSEYVRRSLMWMLGFIHDRIAFYERLDPATNRGQQFQQHLSARWPALVAIVSNLKTDAQNSLANLAALVQKAHFQPFEADYQARKRPKNW
jgi:hypothetical protein